MNLFKKAAAIAMSALVVAAGMPLSANAAAQKITQLDITNQSAAISGDGVYRVIGSGSNNIVVASDTTATITLANAGGSEIKLGSNANVTILLTGNNKFTGVYEPTSSHITISSTVGDGSLDGALTCPNGIGGRQGTSGGNGNGYEEYYDRQCGSSQVGTHYNATNGGDNKDKSQDAQSDGSDSGEITITGGTVTAHIGGGNGGDGGNAEGGKGLNYDTLNYTYSSSPTTNGANGGVGGKASNGGISGLITVSGGKVVGSVGGGDGGTGGSADGGDGADNVNRAGGNGGNAGTGGNGGSGGGSTAIHVTGGEIDGSVGGGMGGNGGSAYGGEGGGSIGGGRNGLAGKGGTSGTGGNGGKSNNIVVSGGTIKGCVGGGSGGCSGMANGGALDVLQSSDGIGTNTGYGTPGIPGTSAQAGNGASATSIIVTGGTVTGHIGGGIGGNSGNTNQGDTYCWASNLHLGGLPNVHGKSGNSGNGAVCNSVNISGGTITGTVGSGVAGNVGTSAIWQHSNYGDYLNSQPLTGTKGTNADFGTVVLNGGFVDISKRDVPFTTGDKGNAVIYTSAIPDVAKKDANTQGILFEHVTGEAYGSRGTVYGTPAIKENMVLPSKDTTGATTMLAITAGKQLTVDKGVTLINRSGSYTQVGGIKIAGKLINNGTIKNAGQINKTGNGTLVKSFGSVYQVAAEMHNNYDGSCKGTNDIVQQDVWLTYGKTYLDSLPFLHRTGYSIIGWQDGSGNQMQANAVVDDINPIQLYAKWAQAGCITTTVTDAVTKKPLQNASVISKDSSGKVFDTVKTDDKGKAVTYLTDGSYTTAVTAPGYEQSAVSAAQAVTTKTSATASFALAPIHGSATVTKINKVTQKPMPVTGILLTDKNGKTVFSGSAENGAAELTVPNLNGPDGPFTVSETETPRGYRVDMTPYMFSLDTQGETAKVQMESTPLTGNVSIMVTDPVTGKPYPAGTEVIVKDDSGNVVGTGKTGADGVVTIPDVPTGTVHITVPGYDSGDTTVNVTDGDTANAAVTAAPIVGALKITNVNTASSAALSVPIVTVKDKDGKTVFSGTTDDGMVLSIPNLTAAASPYTVTSAALHGYAADGKTYTVSITKNGQVEAIELHSVPKTSSATVVITNKDGSIAKNVPVVIKDSTGKVVGSGITDENGHVVIPDLPEGTYTVSVKDKDGNTIDTGKTLTVSVGGTNTVTAVDANETHGSVDVSFTDPTTGKPVAGIGVVVKDKDGKIVAEGSTDENGNVHFPNLPEGDYTVVTKDKDGKEIGNGQKVTATGGKTASTSIKNPAQVGGATFTLTDPVTKKPSMNVPVVLKDKNGNVIAEGTTDEKGQVTFTNIAEGSYTAIVKDKNGKVVGEGQPVTIVGGKTSDIAMTDASKIGNVDMTVTDPATGKSMANADVVLKDKDGKVIATGKTDENGHVVFENVPVGDYTVTVSDSTGKTVIDGKVVSVTGGKSSTVTIGKPAVSSSSSSSSSDVPSESSRPTSSASVVNPPASSSSAPISSNPASTAPTVPTGKADITAKDENGKPMANVPVIIKDCRDNIVARSVTDASGKVIVPNLPDGTYTVSSGDASISLHGSMTIDSGKTSSITLEGSRVPTGNAKLLVLNTAGKPVSHLTLLITTTGSNRQIAAEVVTDVNGYVTLPQMPAGQYVIVAKDSTAYKVNSPLAVIPNTMTAVTVTATPVETKSNNHSKSKSEVIPTAAVKPASTSSGSAVPKSSINFQKAAAASVPKTGQEIIPSLIAVTSLLLSAIGLCCCRKSRKKHSANK